MLSRHLNFRIGIPQHYIRSIEEQQGKIELYREIDIYDILFGKEKCNFPINYDILCDKSDLSNEFTCLCLLDIPSNMIPNEIIRFFQSSIDDISSISIYRHDDYAQNYLGVIHLKDNIAANRFMNQYQNILLSSIDNCYCSLHPIKSIEYCIDNDISSNINKKNVKITTNTPVLLKNNDYDTRYISTTDSKPPIPQNSNLISSRGPSPHMLYHQSLPRKLSHEEIHPLNQFTSISSYEESSNYPGIKFEDDGIYGRSLISPNSAQITGDEDIFCSVCLDIIPKSNHHPMSFTTCCLHTFHIHCISQLERPQCPVCRFQHDDITISSKAYECFVCGWTCNSTTNTTGGGMNCGDEIVPAMRPYSLSYENDLIETNLTYPSNLSKHQQPIDLWSCLVCGFTGCGISHLAHIRNHYEETLHAYAMNTGTRQVWDFSRDGYIHRLILSNPSTSFPHINELPINGINDVHNSRSELYFDNNNKNENNFRTVHTNTQQVLSNQQQFAQEDLQENLIINNKLETAAYNYNQILTWQMEQNQILYMTRLQRIRDSAGMDDINPDISITSNDETSLNPTTEYISSNKLRNNKHVSNPKTVISSNMNEKNWSENIIISLKSEKIKLMKQVDNARERFIRNQKECEVMKELNNSLKKNQIEWNHRLQLANNLYIDTENTLKNQRLELESKVSALMVKLDEVQRTDTGQKYNPKSNPTTSPGYES